MSSNAEFVQAVMGLQAAYERKRDQSKLYCPRDTMEEQRADGVELHTYWFDDGLCLLLPDLPGTLSGDILRLEKNPPAELHGPGCYMIDGDTIRPLEAEPVAPEYPEDFEDCGDALALLPIIEAPDPDKHHLKKPKYRSEIHNLLKCQSRACPGIPLSHYIAQLLGRTADGRLVFEKLEPRYFVLTRFCSITVYKRWIQHALEALQCLHGLGLVHRDLSINNVVFARDGSRLAVCDLECRWGLSEASEISREDTLDAGWTEKSDIFDLGILIQCMIYANIPLTAQVLWPVPPPFDKIVEACMRDAPEQRPSLDELRSMVDAIDAHEEGA